MVYNLIMGEQAKFYICPGPRGGYVLYALSPVHGHLPLFVWDCLADLGDFITTLKDYYDSQVTQIPDVYLREFNDA